MYEKFYGLKEKPFHLNPDARFFFHSSEHKRALAYLNYGVLRGEGFIVVTGEVGTGKTTLIYTLLNELAKHQDILIAHLVTPQLDTYELLSTVATAFGLDCEKLSKPMLLQRFEQFLTDRAREGKRLLLIVDEAQSLSIEGLELLRMLTNFQFNNKAPLQGFLIGQAEFRSTLRSEQLLQLRQRVIASCHLRPLELDETRQYIEHRLNVAGWRNDPTFSMDVYTLIHDFSSGIPRRINNLCERILLVSYLEEAHTVTKELVEAVIQELTDEPLGAYHYQEEKSKSIGAATLGATHEISVTGSDFQNQSAELQLLELEKRLQAVEELVVAPKELRRQLEQAHQARQDLEEKLAVCVRQAEQERSALEAEIDQLMERLSRLHHEHGSNA